MAHVSTFCAEYGGDHPIHRVLVASNGCGATKCIRSARRWCYETFSDEHAVTFISMATPDDINANAEFVRLADEIVEVPGGPNYNNYANVKLIVDIAERLKVDAVWAGWGHASENPALPTALAQKVPPVAFIGPPANAMYLLGDKIASTIIAQSSGGVGEVVNEVPQELFDEACVTTAEQAQERAAKIGYPVMIKASEGGGGKGVRLAHSADQMPSLLSQVKSEVVGSPVFLMKVATKCRHVEVQLMADKHGDCITLFGRDCSVQRRYQKIIEEGPVTVASSEIKEEMQDAAIALAKAVGYQGVGTVEYLYSQTDGYAFLELNPRLQVEHPVSEGITGINIVGCQLCIAMGIPLHRIHDIRKFYGQPTDSDLPIDFSALKAQPPLGHVVACRITAENPRNSFKPTSGTVDQINMRTFPNVWGYFSIPSGGSVHEFADSQFGHIFAFGANRQQAIERLVVTLRELTVSGEIWTTHDFIIRLLESTDFQSENFDTFWLDSLIASDALHKMIKYEVPTTTIVACNATLMAHKKRLGMLSEFGSTLDRGQLPAAHHLISEFPVELTYAGEKFSLVVSHVGQNHYCLVMNDSSVQAAIVDLADGSFLVHLGGTSHKMRAREDPMSFRVTMDGETYVFEKENDPTQLRSVAAGKLIKYLVEDGAHVDKGQPYAEIESMKMVMTLQSTEAGIIHFSTLEGATFGAGDVLGEFDLDDPSLCQRAVPSTAVFPDSIGNPTAPVLKQHRVMAKLMQATDNLVRGLAPPKMKADQEISETIPAVSKLLQDHQVPFMKLREMIDSQCAGLPVEMKQQISKCVDETVKAQSGQYITMLSTRRGADLTETPRRGRSSSFPKTALSFNELPVHSLNMIIQQFVDDCTEPKELEALETALVPLKALLADYEEGYEGYLVEFLRQELNMFLDTHQVLMENYSLEDKMVFLRTKHNNDAALIHAHLLSNKQIDSCIKAILELLKIVQTLNLTSSLVAELQAICNQLTKPLFVSLTRTAQQLLRAYSIPSFDSRKEAMEAALRFCAQPGPTPVAMQLSDPKLPIEEVLVPFFRHPEVDIRTMAIRIFLRREYYMYTLSDISFRSTEGLLFASWSFETAGQAGSQQGVLTTLPSVSTLSDDLPFALKSIAESNKECSAGLVINLVVLSMEHRGMPMLEDQFASTMSDLLRENHELLSQFDSSTTLTAITVPAEGAAPGYFSFRGSGQVVTDFVEVAQLRNVNPPRAVIFELERLSNFDIQVPQGAAHGRGIANSVVYYGCEKENTSVLQDQRLFMRSICTFEPAEESTESLVVEEKIDAQSLQKMLVQVIETLESVILSATVPVTQCNHVFLTTTLSAPGDNTEISRLVGEVCNNMVARLSKNNVMQLEWVFQLETDRLRCFFELGSRLTFYTYLEVDGILTGVGIQGPFDGQSACLPHSVLDETTRRRCRARAMDTTFVYDYIQLFESSASAEWDRTDPELWPTERPTEFVDVQDLVIDMETIEVTGVAAKNIDIKKNQCGMLAWLMTMKTIEYPAGRPVVVITNDITFMSGSFGVQEDYVYTAASRYARKNGFPRIYIAANAGARIGLAEEVKSTLRVAWNDSSDPSKGFKYLYVLEDEFEALNAKTKSIVAERMSHQYEDGNSEVRYQIVDVIGQKHGLGVENLQGSGMIAGETSRAYNDTFSITYTTARTVGIGAYVLRLGQRAVQHNECSIILTGYQPLNKLLGADVYTSNQQLGGTRVMHNNGVSHLCANDDADGIDKIVTWLRFVPSQRGAPLPVTPIAIEELDRDIEWMPTRAPYDPRCMVDGGMGPDGRWLKGFFDCGTWVETLEGWAKSVVVGRGKLGGLPMGAVLVETRTMDKIVPADPASPESKEELQPQAGQVWFPDSAYKTAQAISDFSREGLPIIVFANWRGFSGGMRDMYQEVLKYGSMIVDSLIECKQPVFVYIPPKGELRGGAWVVLDPMINPEVMEMYADLDSRGGVLEPAGIVEIKYREKDLIKTMNRLDPKLLELSTALAEAPESERRAISAEMKQRQKDVMPFYKQVALQFADMHDTPGRMLEKKVIADKLAWRNARRYFYWRLQRRLREFALIKELQDAGLEHKAAKGLLNGWIQELADAALTQDLTDKVVYEMLSVQPKQMAQMLNQMKVDNIRRQLETAGCGAAVDAVTEWLRGLDNGTKSDAKAVLTDFLVSDF